MPLSNETYYLENNPEVGGCPSQAGLIPSAEWHFDNFGWQEGAQSQPVLPCQLSISNRSRCGRGRCPTRWNTCNEFGWQEGARSEHQLQTSSFYLEQNPDLVAGSRHPTRLSIFSLTAHKRGGPPTRISSRLLNSITEAYLEENS